MENSEAPAGGGRATRAVWPAALLILGLALALRLAALGRYVTPDELIWVYRSVLFREALAHGRFAETLVAGHPGVTTTWLGSAAISLQLLLRPADAETYAWITRLAALTPDNMAAFRNLYTFLDGGRTAVALANSLAVAAVYVLARRLFDARAALAAALLLALDPFAAGLGGLLHVDGLLSSGVILSLLALALAADLGQARRPLGVRLGWTAVSGACAALAVLSKTPGLLLPAVAAVTLAAGLWRGRGERPFARRLADVTALGLAWLAAFLIVLVALFPALWADPAGVLGTVSGNTGRHVEEALRPTFFLGDTAFDHGPAFYPVAVLWRLTPLALLGLGLLAAGVWRRETRARLNGPALLLLGGWALLFMIMISVAAKKFDRYALPMFPALLILAAVGLVYAARAGTRPSWPLRGALALAAGLQGIMLLFSLPYLLSSYNLLLGGPYTAQALLPIGWGESISASGRWLAGQPGAAEETAVSGFAMSLAPFFPGETLDGQAEGPEAADNVIVTITGRQEDAAGAAAATTGMALRHTARYGLLPGAWVYANPDPQRAVPIPAPLPEPPEFGGQMRLAAQEIVALAGGDVRYTAQWERLDAASRPLLALTLRDAAGAIWSEVETPLLNEVHFYPPDWAAGERPVVSYLLKLPPAVPPGQYFVEVRLLDGASGGLLPVRGPEGGFGGVVFAAGEVQVDVPPPDVNPGALGMTAVIDEPWAEGALRLLGQGETGARAVAGSALPVELFWQALGPLPPGLGLALRLGDAPPEILPLSRFDSGRWETGRTIQEKYLLPVPPETAAGVYPLQMALVDGAGRPFPGDAITLGEVRIDSLAGLFVLPADIALPLDVTFAGEIHLRGVSPEEPAGLAGGTLPLALVWQAAGGQTAVPLTAFVHLLDEAGAIAAQSDQWPGGLPSNTWRAGQVIVDERALALPPDLPPGDYRLGVGLYDAADGRRLAVTGAGGLAVAGEMVILPVRARVGAGP